MTFDSGIHELVKEVMENKKIYSFLEVEDDPILVFSDNPTDIRNRDPKAIEGYTGKTKTKQGELIAVIPNTRIAQSNDDFEIILNREYDKRLNKLLTKDIGLFRLELIEYIDALIDKHKSKYPFDKNRDHNAIHVAELFKKWLAIEEKSTPRSIGLRAVALAEYYKMKANEGEGLTDVNCRDIAANAGYTSDTSGRKLITDHYNKILSDRDRLGHCGRESAKRKIKLDITKAITLLKDGSSAQKIAQNELSTLLN